jgi:hypothetical protein
VLLAIASLSALSPILLTRIARRVKLDKTPGAWRDAFLPVPRIPRDVDRSSAWVVLGRVYGACAIILVGGAVLRTSAAMRPGGAALIVVALAWAMVPARWIARVFGSRGYARAAFRVMRAMSLEAERRASAVLAAGLSLAWRDRSDPTFAADLALLDEEMALAFGRGPIGVAAHAVLRALHGDAGTTRAVFRMIDGATSALFPGHIRRLALLWLVADDARCGNWGALARRMARHRSWLTPRWCRLLGKIAARLDASEDAPSDLALKVAWIASPHRRRSWPLVARALAAPRRRAPGAALLDADPVRSALLAHRDLLSAKSGADIRAALIRAAKAWDALAAASDNERQRARALAERDVVDLVVEREIPIAELADESPTLSACFDVVAGDLFDEIDSRCRALRARVAERRGLPLIDEWVEWATLWDLIERAYRIGGDRVRRGAFVGTNRDLSHFAVELFNVRRHHRLANAMFRFLLAEARWSNDEQNIKLHFKNSRQRPA